MKFVIHIGCILAVLFLHFSESYAQRESDALKKLTTAIEKEIGGREFASALAAVEIADVRTGKILFSSNTQLLLRPASNAKLFTSAAALLTLPDTAAFQTRLSRIPEAPGTLFCIAGGDPLFSVNDVRVMLDQAQANGVQFVDTLILDGGRFDAAAYGEGWMWDDETSTFQVPISAFCIERNIFTISIKQSSIFVDSLEVTVFPETKYIEWIHDAKASEFSVTKIPRSNTIVISGMPGGKSSSTHRIPMWSPKEIFADVLARSLRTSGMADSSLVVFFGAAPSRTHETAAIHRHLDEVLAACNKRSDNLAAEMLLRLLGMHAGEHASARDGLAAMKNAFALQGLGVGAISLVDGSGISFYNLVTVATLGRVLRLMAAHSTFERFRSSLAIGGTDGTLRTRMSSVPRARFFQGKTGTIRGVSTLAGYVQAPGGRLLTVVLFMQNFSGPHRPYRIVQDRIVRHCLDYSASPAAVRAPR